jgi:hypothetical protein
MTLARTKAMLETSITYVAYCPRCDREFVRSEDLDVADKAVREHAATYAHLTFVREFTVKPVRMYRGTGGRHGFVRSSHSWPAAADREWRAKHPPTYKHRPVTLKDIEAREAKAAPPAPAPAPPPITLPDTSFGPEKH